MLQCNSHQSLYIDKIPHGLHIEACIVLAVIKEKPSISQSVEQFPIVLLHDPAQCPVQSDREQIRHRGSYQVRILKGLNAFAVSEEGKEPGRARLDARDRGAAALEKGYIGAPKEQVLSYVVAAVASLNYEGRPVGRQVAATRPALGSPRAEWRWRGWVRA